MKSVTGTVIIFFVLIECRANFTDLRATRNSFKIDIKRKFFHVHYLINFAAFPTVQIKR